MCFPIVSWLFVVFFFFRTALIKFMAAQTKTPLFVLNVHGGVTGDQVREWMEKPIARAVAEPGTEVFVFFDEINTAPCGSLFKTIVCDRFLNGCQLPENLRFIACANPYRSAAGKAQQTAATNGSSSSPTGLSYAQHTASTARAQTEATLHELAPWEEWDGGLDGLVYRVHPLVGVLFCW
jgi:hypothetical protein